MNKQKLIEEFNNKFEIGIHFNGKEKEQHAYQNKDGACADVVNKDITDFLIEKINQVIDSCPIPNEEAVKDKWFVKNLNEWKTNLKDNLPDFKQKNLHPNITDKKLIDMEKKSRGKHNTIVRQMGG